MTDRVKIKLFGFIPINEPEGDWYEAWLAMWFPGTRWRGLQCLLFGHRKVVEIPHNEICEQVWDMGGQHLEHNKDVIERFCRNCDSGYLKTTTRSEK